MGKVITSPVKKWPGTVTLCDPLSLPQVVEVRKALESAIEVAGSGETDKDGDRIIADLAAYHNELLPAFLSCVEIWELEGLENPPNPFPGTPRASAAELMNWLSTEVIALFAEAETAPNE